MAANSTIEWTDATWNPVTGCTKISAGCDHLSLSRLNHRLPWSQTHPEVMHGTTAFHPQIADALLPQAEPVCDDAAMLDTAVDMFDPQPTLVELLVHLVLLSREFLPQIEINSIFYRVIFFLAAITRFLF